jgi:hypothetical protein
MSRGKSDVYCKLLYAARGVSVTDLPRSRFDVLRLLRIFGHVSSYCISVFKRLAHQGKFIDVHLHHLEATVKRQGHDEGDVIALDYEPAEFWGAWLVYEERGQHEHEHGAMKQIPDLPPQPHSQPRQRASIIL